MTGVTEGIVKPPPTDVPALADSTTASLFNLQTRRYQGNKITLVGFPLVLAGMVIGLVGRLSWDYIITMGVLLVVQVQALYLLVRFSRVGSRTKPLLATQAWRPVPAQVRDHAVWIQDGEQRWRVRPTGMPALAKQVVASTGRAWIVGPDAYGWLALRVDGSHAVWPGRSTPTETTPEATTNPPTAEQITESCARLAARQLQLRLAGGVLMAAFAGGYIALMAWLTHDPVMLAIMLPLVFVAWAISMVGVARGRDDLALPELIRAGPWQRADVQLRPWKVHWSSPTCSATGTTRLQDGSTFEITLRRVGLDVYANAWETGSLWLAGNPVPGRKVAVGFPGYPALGVALVS